MRLRNSLHRLCSKTSSCVQFCYSSTTTPLCSKLTAAPKIYNHGYSKPCDQTRDKWYRSNWHLIKQWRLFTSRQIQQESRLCHFNVIISERIHIYQHVIKLTIQSNSEWSIVCLKMKLGNRKAVVKIIPLNCMHCKYFGIRQFWKKAWQCRHMRSSNLGDEGVEESVRR